STRSLTKKARWPSGNQSRRLGGNSRSCSGTYRRYVFAIARSVVHFAPKPSALNKAVHPMGIEFRVAVMNFMLFFVWGSWLTSLGAYMIVTLDFAGSQVGDIYAT